MVDQSKLILHFALMTPLGALSTALVGLRFYTRLYITKMRLAADDYLIFVAMFLSNASAIMVGVADFAFDEGQALGNSRSDIYKKVGMRKIHWIATQIYPIMSFSLKISILLLYRRIFFVVPTFTRVCNVLIIIITAIHLAGFTSGVFLCMPISYFWKQAIPPGYPGAPTHRGRCQNYQVAWLVLGSFNVITDLIAVVLPLPVLGRLRITAARRASLIFIFALSSVPVIASLLRIRPLARIPGGNDDPLFSQHVWELQLYCGIEISVGITCACLPTLSPLATRMCPKMMASLGGVVSDPIDHAAGSGSGGGGWRGLKSRKASDDAAMNADADGGFINSVATIGGTSARSGRKGSVGKGRGRKRSDATAYSDISTIMTDDESTETKTTATMVPRELEHDVEDQIPLSPKDKTDTDKAPLEKAKEHTTPPKRPSSGGHQRRGQGEMEIEPAPPA
ncbi:hypothetical protein IWZ00DRAFT_298987 [Phyllosticta capitalensis]